MGLRPGNGDVTDTSRDCEIFVSLTHLGRTLFNFQARANGVVLHCSNPRSERGDGVFGFTKLFLH